jgi:hypothetical protein
MKTAICAILASCLASTAFAGDQPVIFVPTLPPVFKDKGGVIYYMTSTGVGTGIDFAVGNDALPLATTPTTRSVTGAEVASASGGTATRGAVADTGRTARATRLPVASTSDDALYSALLKEARARGLR